MKTKELIKQLKIDTNCSYLIFVSKDTGLYPEDLENIDLGTLGAKEYMFVYVEGNVAELIKIHKVKKNKPTK